MVTTIRLLLIGLLASCALLSAAHALGVQPGLGHGSAHSGWEHANGTVRMVRFPDAPPVSQGKSGNAQWMCKGKRPAYPTKALIEDVSAVINAQMQVGVDGRVTDVKFLSNNVESKVLRNQFEQSIREVVKTYECSRDPNGPYVASQQFVFNASPPFTGLPPPIKTPQPLK